MCQSEQTESTLLYICIFRYILTKENIALQASMHWKEFWYISIFLWNKFGKLFIVTSSHIHFLRNLSFIVLYMLNNFFSIQFLLSLFLCDIFRGLVCVLFLLRRNAWESLNKKFQDLFQCISYYMLHFIMHNRSYSIDFNFSI